jgi:hypothetical protein
MPYIARDQLLYVHQREAVLTTSQADDWRAGQSGRGAAPITVIVNNPRPEPASTSTKRELRKLAVTGMLG